MTEPGISDLDFEKFREFFYRKTGIQFETSKRYFVDKRLIERIELTHSGGFRNYFTLLRFEASGEELQCLTNLMTVNETYFFREEYQFQCLVMSILPDIVSRKNSKSPIRIGSFPLRRAKKPIRLLCICWSTGPGSKNGTSKSFPRTSIPRSSPKPAAGCTRNVRCNICP
jgi:chemotaxis protein methyltransferase CheR